MIIFGMDSIQYVSVNGECLYLYDTLGSLVGREDWDQRNVLITEEGKAITLPNWNGEKVLLWIWTGQLDYCQSSSTIENVPVEKIQAMLSLNREFCIAKHYTDEDHVKGLMEILNRQEVFVADYAYDNCDGHLWSYFLNLVVAVRDGKDFSPMLKSMREKITSD